MYETQSGDAHLEKVKNQIQFSVFSHINNKFSTNMKKYLFFIEVFRKFALMGVNKLLIIHGNQVLHSLNSDEKWDIVKFIGEDRNL